MLDPSGAAIAEAAVELSGADVRQDLTDADGSFSFAGLDRGIYLLTVAAQGFAVSSTELNLGEGPGALTIQLRIEDQIQTVEVAASSGPGGAPLPDENPDRIELSGEQLQALPALDGDIVGTLQSFLDGGSFGGDGGGLVVDGVETSELGVSASAIEEIRINKDPYSAEFSRPGRSRIEIITKKGAQELHGQLNLRLRHHRMDARNAFGSIRPEQRRLGIEGHVGGPLGKGGKHSFLIGGERDQDRQASFVFATTPEGVVREALISPETESEVSFRWDRTPDYARALSVRYEYELESERNAGAGGFVLPEAASDRRERDQDVSWSYRRVFSSSTLFEWRGRAGRETDRENSRADGPRLIVLDAFTAGGGQRNRSGRETKVESSGVVSQQIGAHYVRAGLLLRELAHKRFSDSDNYGGTFRFASIADFEAGRPFSYSLREGDPTLAFWDIEIAGFVQDNIRINNRATLALGLRYDRQNFGGDHDNFAPRASIAFGAGPEGRTTVRIGGGVFYDNIGSGAYEDRLRFGSARVREVLLLNPGYPDPFAGGGSLDSPPPNLVRWSPALKTPYVGQYSASVERRLSDRAVLSASWTRTVGVGLLRSLDRNAPMPGSGARPAAEAGIVRELESSARMEASSFRTQLRGTLASFFQGTVRYTWGRAYNDVEDDDALPANSLDLSREWGPAEFDRRHRFDTLGALSVKDWFQLGVVLEAESARPYTVTTGIDDNRDGIAKDRPAGVARNTERGAGSLEVDMRLSKELGGPTLFGPGDEPTRLTLVLDAFNVLNTVNPRSFVGNMRSPLFGQPTSAGSARRMQAGLRWSF